ncbi:MAG: hypothetical protein M3R55_16280 [Acidobacteriota bacterium]|nr:hypothetical protein [Acidobacteriota bacterium]
MAPFFLSLALATFVAPLAAQEKTLKGEVIDIKCHQGKGHEVCATACVKRGEAAGIKVGDEIYMIIGDWTADQNKKLVEFVAKDVEATGTIGEKDGHKTITLTAIKLAK